MFVTRFSADAAPEDNQRLWQRHPGNPILRPRPGTWASEWIANGSVVELGNDYLMYIDGKAGPVERIGVVRARVAGFDGVHWREYPGNPILDIGPGGYDDVGVFDPCVLAMDGKWWMYYTGVSGPPDRICLATSDDGYHWTKHQKNPLVNGRCPHVLLHRGTLHLFYQGFNEDGGYNIHLATSANAVDFVRHPLRPILPRSPEGQWDWLSVVNPRVFEEDGQFYMLYAGDAERVAATFTHRSIGPTCSRDGKASIL